MTRSNQNAQKRHRFTPLVFVVFTLCTLLSFRLTGRITATGIQESSLSKLASKAEFGTENVKSSNSESKGAVVTLFNGTEGCTINRSGIKFLGSGDRGHTYSAMMECPNGNQELVAFKVAKTWKQGPIHYISSSNVEKKRTLYNRLLTTDENANKFISVQFGTVLIPRDMLYDGMNQANAAFVRKVSNVTDEIELKSMLVADVFTVNSGLELGKLLRKSDKKLNLATRRKIAKDLVYIYRHLYKHLVLHCDVRMNHILHSVEDMQTMLIDFEDFYFLEDLEKKDLVIQSQQGQLWQLFLLLGNACSHVDFDIPWSGCRASVRNRTAIMQQLVPALKECGFHQPMEWRNETGINVALTYTDLSTWCGLE